MNKQILIIDDDLEVSNLISDVLSDEGYETNITNNFVDAMNYLKHNIPAVIFLDLWMNNDEIAGLKILEKIKKNYIESSIIMISGHGSIDVAVSAIKNGAFDFIEKPFVIDKLLFACERGVEIFNLKKENVALKNKQIDLNVLRIGVSSFAKNIRNYIEKLSSNDSRIFIKGNIGTCCDNVGYAIHKQSNRKNYNFTTFSCVSDDAEKIENELFGTEKIDGVLERINGGTILLTDVISMPQNIQRKLLQFIQDGRYIVGKRSLYLDVRIISSDTIDAAFNALNKFCFNKELFYRLNVVELELVELARRKEDIKFIVQYYLENSKNLYGFKAKNISNSIYTIFESYDWPGNLVQLKNVLENILIKSLDAKIDLIDETFLPAELLNKIDEKFDSLNTMKLLSLPLKEAKDVFETEYLINQLNRFSGNVTQTANFIGMERSALHKKLKLLNVHYRDI